MRFFLGDIKTYNPCYGLLTIISVREDPTKCNVYMNSLPNVKCCKITNGCRCRWHILRTSKRLSGVLVRNTSGTIRPNFNYPILDTILSSISVLKHRPKEGSPSTGARRNITKIAFAMFLFIFFSFCFVEINFESLMGKRRSGKLVCPWMVK